MAKLDNGGDGPPSRTALAWVPPFIAGAAAAVAAELAAGLLLYSALGFLRALTVVLAVEMVAFGLGLWSARTGRPTDLEGVRRRWLMALAAYSVAAGFSFLWSVGGAAARPLTQGLGLALLGGLPMFSVAALLGTMGEMEDERGRRGGPSAAFGAATGFLATGFVFVPVLEAASILLVCVIALSVGALLHGWVWSAPEPVVTLDSGWTPPVQGAADAREPAPEP